MEVALDVGQADTDDRVVQEGEEEDATEGGQGDSLGTRSEAALLDLQSGDSTGAVGLNAVHGDTGVMTTLS